MQLFAALDNGNFVVAWYGQENFINDIKVQIFDKDGNKIGDDFTANTYSVSSSQNYPDITSTSDGGFVLAWYSEGQDGSLGSIVIRKFDPTGNALTDEIFGDFTRPVDGNSDENHPNIIELNDGNLAVTWQSKPVDVQNGGDWDIDTAIINLQDNTSQVNIIAKQTVNTTDDSYTNYPHSSVALNDGGYVVVWFNEAPAWDKITRAVYSITMAMQLEMSFR